MVSTVAVIEPLHTEHMCLLEQLMLLQEEPQSLLDKALVFMLRQSQRNALPLFIILRIMHILQEVATAISTKDTSLVTALQRVRLEPADLPTISQLWLERESQALDSIHFVVLIVNADQAAAPLIPTKELRLKRPDTIPSTERERSITPLSAVEILTADNTVLEQ